MSASPGHTPAQKPLPQHWIIEGMMLDGNSRARSRLEVDSALGEIVARGDLPGKPAIVLGDDELLLPGFLDIHVHCRDDPSGREAYKEDFTSSSRAALHGGVVLLGDMPNNPQPPIDPASYRAKLELAEMRALVDVVPYVGVTRGGKPIDAPAPYKCYFGPSIGPLNLTRDDSAEEILKAYQGVLIAFHAESLAVLAANRDAPTHEQRRPAEAEAAAIADIAAIARRHSLQVHIAHLSSAAGLAEVRKARAAGVRMSCEVAPHHLFFDRSNRAGFARGDWLQMNPPLREPADRLALKEAFTSGEIEILATDHAPHSIDENKRGISGVPHLDTYGAFLTWLAQEGMPWKELAARAARAPAALFAPYTRGKFGSLEAGSVASFTVIHPRQPWRVSASDLCTRSGWSPFEGFEFPGRVTMTAIRGKLYVMK